MKNGKFCCWKYEEREGRKTKVPYNPLTGQNARSNDISSFTDFMTAYGAPGYDGIGIGIFDGICAVDLDDCVTDDGSISAEAEEIIKLMHSYTEYSPGGKGIHILFRADGFHYDSERYPFDKACVSGCAPEPALCVNRNPLEISECMMCVTEKCGPYYCFSRPFQPIFSSEFLGKM